MKLSHILIIIAVCGVILIMASSILYTAGVVVFENYKIFLMAGTIIWFSGILLSNLVKRNVNDQAK